MAVILLIILLGALAYLWWKWSKTTLTRNCRWRKSAAQNQWNCAYCGATTPDVGAAPLQCLDPNRMSRPPEM
jgi:hypothetical protein